MMFWMRSERMRRRCEHNPPGIRPAQTKFSKRRTKHSPLTSEFREVACALKLNKGASMRDYTGYEDLHFFERSSKRRR